MQGDVRLKPRNRKTSDFIRETGIHLDDMLSILAELKPKHYHRGPSADHNGSEGEIMEFIYPEKAPKFYIKLKLLTLQARKVCDIMSFHEEGSYE